MKKISINLVSHLEDGEGSVRITPGFENQSYLFQLDVLKDWIEELQNEYALRWELWSEQIESLDPGPERQDATG
tara:strand:- start:597 stop:818 length:222 start_codon:yes stop_codon:yes gene_type:complete